MKPLIIVSLFLALASGSYYLYSTPDNSKQTAASLIPSAQSGENKVPDIKENNTVSFSDEQPEKQLRLKNENQITIKPDRFQMLDEYAEKTPEKYARNIQPLTEYLIIPA